MAITIVYFFYPILYLHWVMTYPHAPPSTLQLSLFALVLVVAYLNIQGME